jgi:hypothetical protein
VHTLHIWLQQFGQGWLPWGSHVTFRHSGSKGANATTSLKEQRSNITVAMRSVIAVHIDAVTTSVKLGLLMTSQQVEQNSTFPYAVFRQLPKLARVGGRYCGIFGLIYKEVICKATCKCKHLHITYTSGCSGLVKDSWHEAAVRAFRHSEPLGGGATVSHQ